MMQAVSSNGFAVANANNTGAASDNPCECCNQSRWNRAVLCNAGNAPPGIPYDITFRAGFVCLDGCPVSGSRLVMYRGYCYTVVAGSGTVECQGPRPKPEEYPAPYFGATVVSWAELMCKTLAADCLNQTCVPIEPGCCSEPYRGCKMPKRFRIHHTARYRFRSTAYADAGQCAGLSVCEEVFIDVDLYADYECDENNVRSDGTAPVVCYNAGGAVVISGLNRGSSQVPPVNLNGTYPARPVSEQRLTEFVTPAPLMRSPIKWIPDDLLGEFFFQFGQGFCSGDHRYAQDDPPGCVTREDYSPAPSVRITREIVNCNYWNASDVTYSDCFLFDRVMHSVGFSSPPCPRDERWNDAGVERVVTLALAGCERRLDTGDPVGPGRPSVAGVPYEDEPVQLSSWLGVNWRGTPFPKRLYEFVTKGTPLGQDPGCGCIDRLKRLVE